MKLCAQKQRFIASISVCPNQPEEALQKQITLEGITVQYMPGLP